MLNYIRELWMWYSLSNPKNWYLYSEQKWSLEMDGMSKPRKFYRHKKHSYYITNVFIKSPLHISDLINRFLLDYKTKKLLMGETLYVVSD